MALRVCIALLVAVSTGLVWVPALAPSTAPASSLPDAPADRPPALWLQTSASPTQTQLEEAAGRFRVAVFNPWETAAAAELKQRDPGVLVLAYKCLSSTRSYDGAVVDGRDPGGVGWERAQEHAEWFAASAEGERIEWDTYSGHWQMAVWEQSYRDAWTSEVMDELGDSVFDGVLADNALGTLSHYTDVELADGRSDEDLRDGVQALVEQAGGELNEAGKLFVPNIGEGRLHDGWWPALSRFGGGFEEQFVHFGEDPDDGYLSGTSSTGWERQVSLLAEGGLPLVRTSAGPEDDRAFRYGLASFLIATGGRGAFTATGRDAYDGTRLREEQTWDLGKPTGERELVDGAWVRRFERGLAAVNTSADDSVEIEVPAGASDAQGSVEGRVVLPPHTGVLLRTGG